MSYYYGNRYFFLCGGQSMICSHLNKLKGEYDYLLLKHHTMEIMRYNRLNEGLYDCHQSVMADILNGFGYDSSVVALGKLSFCYTDEYRKKIGERIEALYIRKNSNRKKLFGIIQEERELPEDLEQMDRYISMGIPIVLWGDLIDCDWNDAYKKYHFIHCFMIDGKENEEYYINDPYFQKYGIKKSIADILKISKEYSVYLKGAIQLDQVDRVYQEIVADAKHYLDNKMGENIMHFCDDLINTNLLLECDFPNKDLYAVPLIDNLKIVGQQRGAYSVLIRNMGDKLGLEWDNIANNLNKSMMYWERVRMYIIKTILLEREYCDKNVLKENFSIIKTLEYQALSNIYI